VVRETNKRSRSARETEPKTDDVHDDAEDQEEDAEEEVSHDEEDHDETDDGEEIDEDDPVAMLIAQGVSEEMAKGALARSNGDLDAAVMLVIQWRELEKEEKEMAKVMQESLREAEEEAAKREAEESEKKTTSPAEFFEGSAFLEHLGEDVAEVLLREDSPAKADVIATLEFERKCKRWYRNSAREVDEKFAAVAAEIVARVEVEKRAEPAAGAEPGVSGAAAREGEGGGGGAWGGGDTIPGVGMAHSVLVAHLTELQEAVLAMPEKSGGVPDVFSPRKDRPPDAIDLTAE
jgi:NACalpha-BTF3-like transcription factor